MDNDFVYWPVHIGRLQTFSRLFVLSSWWSRATPLPGAPGCKVGGASCLLALSQIDGKLKVPRSTVLSIDAVGAFDHVSCHAMLAGLQEGPSLQPLLPYVPPTAHGVEN